MDLTKAPQRQDDYTLEVIDDEILLYHPSKEQILYCNPTASLVWNLCDGKRTLQEIIDLLTEAYPDSTEAITKDTQNTLQMFETQGAIQFV